MKAASSAIAIWLLTAVLIGLSLVSFVYSMVAGKSVTTDGATLAVAALWGLVPVVFAAMAGLILSRQPRNAIGWLLLLPALALANDGSFTTYFGGLANPPAAPSPFFVLAYWFYGWSWLLLLFPVLFILLLFPTGRSLTRAWRWVTGYVFFVCLLFFVLIAFSQSIVRDGVSWVIRNPVGLFANAWIEQHSALPFTVGLLTITVLSVTAVFVRFRRAGAVEREQTKWLVYACSLFAVVYLAGIVLRSGGTDWSAGLWLALGPLALMAIPAAIAIAILRYRLWDIDVVIRRTLVYATLSALLALVFFGSVILLQRVFEAATGQQSQLAIVLSTLAIAALFNPLRTRVQAWIDRRFYRKKYDAQQVLAKFAVTARDETDMNALTAELARVVQETMQPAGATVWLRNWKDRQQR